MDHGAGIDLEDQQPPIIRFGAIDDQVVEPETLIDRRECRAMAQRKVLVEAAHETLFLGALHGALGHAGVEVMDHPVFRDAHVHGERARADQDHPILAELSVRPTIIDEAGDIELALGAALKVAGQRRRIIELREAPAGMRVGRPGDDRETTEIRQGGYSQLRASQLFQGPPGDSQRGRHRHPGRFREPARGALARSPERSFGAVDHRARPGPDGILDLREQGTRAIGFADGDKQHVMLGQLRRQGQLRRDIEHVERDIGTRQEKVERRVGHQIARRHQRQQPDAGLASLSTLGRQAIKRLDGQRLGLHRQGDFDLAEELQDRGQVHQGIGIVRIGRRPIHQEGPQRLQIDVFKRHGHEPCLTDQRVA